MMGLTHMKKILFLFRTGLGSRQRKHSKAIGELLRRHGWTTHDLRIDTGKNHYGVPQWSERNGKPDAWLWWEEHGCLFVNKKAKTFFRWSIDNGIAPLCADYGYLDRQNTYFIDRYDENGEGCISREWRDISDEPIDWNSVDPRFNAYRRQVLERYEEARNQKPLRDPGYVAVFTQFSPWLSHMHGKNRTDWASWAQEIERRLKAAGERVVFKGSPVEKKTEWPEGMDYFPHRSNMPNLTARIAVHAKYCLVISTSLTNEFLLAGIPTLAVGGSWFSGRGVFAEARSWDEIGKVTPTAPWWSRNRYLRWWLSNQCYLEDVPDRVARLVEERVQHGSPSRERARRPVLIVHSDHGKPDPLLQVCEKLGIPSERRGRSLEEIETPGEVHLVWGMTHKPSVYRRLAKHDNVFFAENAWFPQSAGCYVDRTGPNALSSICGSIQDDSPLDEEGVTGFVRELHSRMDLSNSPAAKLDLKGYMFVPLQAERDAQILYWSHCKGKRGWRQAWFVDQLCKAFPNEQIVIRPHPRDPQTARRIEETSEEFRNHPNASFQTAGNSYQWLARAKAVVGITSTVLLEALTFYKPVCAMGSGLFSGNRVVLECNGDETVLQKLSSYQPDRKRITQFLTLLLKRTVPYDMKPEEAQRYPVFVELLQAARKHSRRSLTRKKPRVAEQIYGAVTEERWRDDYPAAPEEIVKLVSRQGAMGVYLIEPDVDEGVERFSSLCQAAGLEFILGFTDSPQTPDVGRLERAKAIASRLAIGSTRYHEWVGGSGRAKVYLEMAERFGYEWVCPVTHRTILQDLRRGGALRRVLGDTLCFCLCGYVLAGYLFGDPRIPHQGFVPNTSPPEKWTTLTGRNLHEEFGLTVESLSEYLEPMNVLSGAGLQGGLSAGSRVYARRLGFKGLLVGLPFDLTGTDAVRVNAKPSRYPERCGDYTQGYVLAETEIG